VGFVGGEWRGREFFYNRAVNNFGHVHIANVYYHQVGFGRHENRVSFNGGPGGLHARPGRNELAAEHERHFEATSMQQHNVSAARHDHSQFANVNHGRPNVVAASRPGEFHGSNVVRAGSPASRPQEFHGQEQNHTLSRPPAPRGGGAPHENMNRPNYPNSRARVAGRENNPGREFHPAATPRDAGPRRPEANVHPQRRAPQPERQMQRGPERAHAEGGHAKGGRGPGHGR